MDKGGVEGRCREPEHHNTMVLSAGIPPRNKEMFYHMKRVNLGEEYAFDEAHPKDAWDVQIYW